MQGSTEVTLKALALGERTMGLDLEAGPVFSAGLLNHAVGSKKYPSRLDRRAESFFSPQDEA